MRSGRLLANLLRDSARSAEAAIACAMFVAEGLTIDGFVCLVFAVARRGGEKRYACRFRQRISRSISDWAGPDRGYNEECRAASSGCTLGSSGSLSRI